MASEKSFEELLQLAQIDSLSIDELIQHAEQYHVLGKYHETEQLYSTWLHHSSSIQKFAIAFNLGVILGEQNKFAEAEAMYRLALSSKRDFPPCQINLASTLMHQNKSEEAIKYWRKAIESPSISNDEKKYCLSNLGLHLEREGKFPEALSYLKQCYALDVTQRPVLYHMIFLAMKMCQWPIYNPPAGITLQEMINATSALAMLAISDDPALQLQAGKTFIDGRYASAPIDQLAPTKGYNHQKLRIGYLSCDFRAHAVSMLTVELLELHNRDHFEVYGFFWNEIDGSDLQERILKAMDVQVQIGSMNDREAAEVIRQNEIDIIIDLNGLTAGARPNILAYRPAPLQMTYLGFPGTTALPWIDHVIADRFLIPEELTPFHTEKPLYMPHCFQASDRKRPVVGKLSKKDVGLPEDKFIFCCFNNNYKITEELFKRWMNILKKVSNSILWIVTANKWAKENLIKVAKKQGITKDRLIFADRVSPEIYLAQYQLADLFLDTFPFNGGTTANDVLFMELPLLTLTGRTFASRMAGSLLKNLNLPELITYSYDEYEETAVRLANTPAERLALKQRLIENKRTGPVFDTPRFVSDYENLVAAAYKEKCSGVTKMDQSSNEEPKNATQQSLTLLTMQNGVFTKTPLPTIPSPTAWGDYETIRNYLRNTELEENCWYGFFGSRFPELTGLNYDQVEEFLSKKQGDVYTFSPLPDMSSFFINVFEQLNVFDSGSMDLFQNSIIEAGLDIDLSKLIMDSSQVVFGNFLMAKKDFWIQWFTLAERLHLFIENKPLEYRSQFITPSSNRKTALIERVASLILSSNDWNVVPYNTFTLPWSNMPMSSFKHEAILSDALKRAYLQTGQNDYMQAFSKIRESVFFQQK